MPASTSPDSAIESIFDPAWRATSIGMIALVALSAFEALAVATAMPTVARELDGLRLYALAFGGTLAASVVGMTMAGRWSDRSGPAAPLYAGLAGFVLGLLLAGSSQHMWMLIAGRLFQGLGAGAYSVALYVIVGRLYPPRLQPKMFAAFSAAWVVPSLIGPALSGAIVEHAHWRWVFLAVPLLAVPAGLLLRKPLRGLRGGTPQDDSGNTIAWAGGAAIAILALYLSGQRHDLAGLSAGAGAVGLLLFCLWRLLPAGTLRARRGLPSVIAMRGVAAAAFFGCEAFLPLLLSRWRGQSPMQAGIALSIGALGWFAGSWYQGHNRHDWPRARLLQVGAGLMCAGLAMTALVLTPLPVAVAIGGWALTGLGMGLVYPSLSLLTLSLSPPQAQGRNSSALQLSEAIGVATTLAITGSVFAWLLSRAPQMAYAVCLAVSAALALLAWRIAGRVRDQTAVGSH